MFGSFLFNSDRNIQELPFTVCTILVSEWVGEWVSVVYFNQLLGAAHTQKQDELHVDFRPEIIEKG